MPARLRKKIAEKGLEYFVECYVYENRTRNFISLSRNECFCIGELSDEVADSLAFLREYSGINIAIEEHSENGEKHNVIAHRRYRVIRLQEAETKPAKRKRNKSRVSA